MQEELASCGPFSVIRTIIRNRKVNDHCMIKWIYRTCYSKSGARRSEQALDYD